MEKTFWKTVFAKPDPRRNTIFILQNLNLLMKKNSPQKNQAQMVPQGNSFKYLRKKVSLN